MKKSITRSSSLIIFISTLLTFLSACNGIKGITPDQGPAITKKLSTDWASFIINKKYLVLNNVWNKQASTGKYYQDIFQGNSNGKKFVGWSWDWQGKGDWVLAYPEIGCGDNPWNEKKGLAKGFPFKAGSKKLIVDFDIELEASGKLDMAFECWAISRLPNNKKNLSHEIMILNYIRNVPSPDSWAKNIGTFKADGIVYDIYYKVNHGDDSGANSNKWSITMFIARTPFFKGRLKVHKFINYMLKKKLMTRSNYITNLELGNEIWYGKGVTKIKRYDVKFL